jgi:hypothetical protein
MSSRKLNEQQQRPSRRVGSREAYCTAKARAFQWEAETLSPTLAAQGWDTPAESQARGPSPSLRSASG